MLLKTHTNVKTKLSRSTTRKYTRGVEVQLYTFFTVALEGGEWSVSCPGHTSLPGKNQWIRGGWMTPRGQAGSFGEEKIFLPLPGIEPRTLYHVAQSNTVRYGGWIFRSSGSWHRTVRHTNTEASNGREDRLVHLSPKYRWSPTKPHGVITEGKSILTYLLTYLLTPWSLGASGLTGPEPKCKFNLIYSMEQES